LTNDKETEREQRLRLFVAVELPQAWRDGFEGLMAEMKAALAADSQTKSVRVRWVRPEGIHLTLKFLGETPQGKLEGVNHSLKQAVTAPPGIRLQIGHVGSFSDRRAPRVVWAGVEGQTKELAALAERVDTWLASAGYTRERRGLTPHLTLARLPEDLSQTERESVAAITNGFAVPALEPFTVESVSLMRSHLGPGGARYERLAAFPA
jgi:2'-5' RNA ligase